MEGPCWVPLQLLTGGEAGLSRGLQDGRGGWGQAGARMVLNNRKVASAVIKQRRTLSVCCQSAGRHHNTGAVLPMVLLL